MQNDKYFIPKASSVQEDMYDAICRLGENLDNERFVDFQVGNILVSISKLITKCSKVGGTGAVITKMDFPNGELTSEERYFLFFAKPIRERVCKALEEQGYLVTRNEDSYVIDWA